MSLARQMGWLPALGALVLGAACQRDALAPASDGAVVIGDLATADRPPADLADAAPACSFPADEELTLRVRELDGFADVQCWDIHGYGESISVDAVGVVTTVDGAKGLFVVDTCPAWVQCKRPRRIEVTFTWPGRGTQLLFSGAFVRLRADVATFEWYCTASLEVTSVAAIAGHSNPDGLGEGALYGAARRGGVPSYPGSPLTVTSEPTGCTREDPTPTQCGWDGHQELHLLHFAVDSADTPVPMGSSSPIAGTPGARSAYGLSASSLRSYSQGCTDERGFEWVVLPQLSPGG